MCNEISTKVLEISATYVCSPLTYICNNSNFLGIFPDCLKFPIIKPTYKKGNYGIPIAPMWSPVLHTFAHCGGILYTPYAVGHLSESFLSDSSRHKFSWIYSCIWKAEILGHFGSKMHAMVFWRSTILIRYQHENKHSTCCTLPDITTYTLSLQHALRRTTTHHYDSKQTA